MSAKSQKLRTVFLAVPAVLVVLLGASCSKSSSSSISITRVKPPVQETAGTAMTASALTAALKDAQPLTNTMQQDIKDRFFSTGPTDVMNILASVDERLAGLETQVKDNGSTCINNTAVDKTLTIFGESVTFSFQCYEKVGSDGIIAFGKKDETWSVYVMIGAGPIAAKATDLGGGKTAVEIWGAVGFGNTPAWDAMSYTGFHIKANNSTGALEMTAGGMGVGFCGVTLKADGTNMYAYGSADGGGTACATLASSCVQMSDLTSAGICTSITEANFELTGLGRKSASKTGGGTWAASPYPASPGGGTLTLDGTSTDMIHFGITSEADLPAGVSAL